MKAGPLKFRLTLLRPAHETDAFGSERIIYENAGTIHAERVKIGGSRKEEVGEHFPDYRVEFNIRRSHAVEENWRVRELGGKLYTVTNVIPNLNRGYNTLVCERVNE